MSTKKLFAHSPSALHGLGELQAVLECYERSNKWEKTKMRNVETFIKNAAIIDPERIQYVKDVSAKLTEKNLPVSKRVDVVFDVLKKTSSSCHDLSSKSVFIEEDKNLFLQDVRIAEFFLETAFPSKNALFRKAVEKGIAKFSGEIVFDSDRETWENLKYEAMGVVASDLAVELTQLRLDLGTQAPYFTPAVKVCSLTHDLFKSQVYKVDNIFQKGWEELIRANME